MVDDRRIISLVKKNPFTTVGQIKNTLQEVGVCVSKSTIKRRLHQSEYRGFTTRCEPLVSLKNRKTRLEFAKHRKKLWKTECWALVYDNSFDLPAHMAVSSVYNAGTGSLWSSQSAESPRLWKATSWSSFVWGRAEVKNTLFSHWRSHFKINGITWFNIIELKMLWGIC